MHVSEQREKVYQQPALRCRQADFAVFSCWPEGCNLIAPSLLQEESRSQLLPPSLLFSLSDKGVFLCLDAIHVSTQFNLVLEIWI